MTIRIDVSEEVAHTLQQLAETEHLSISELLANMTEYYEVERQTRSSLTNKPDPTGITHINASDTEISEPGAKLYVTEEILAELTDDCDD